MRNATISGYGLATIVVEAGEHSGARAQARMAVEHGRPVILTDLVLARTEWAKTLVGRPGVHLARSTEDVVQVVRHLVTWPNEVQETLQRLVGV
jgi:DNA processing protein